MPSLETNQDCFVPILVTALPSVVQVLGSVEQKEMGRVGRALLLYCPVAPSLSGEGDVGLCSQPAGFSWLCLKERKGRIRVTGSFTLNKWLEAQQQGTAGWNRGCGFPGTGRRKLGPGSEAGGQVSSARFLLQLGVIIIVCIGVCTEAQ